MKAAGLRGTFGLCYCFIYLFCFEFIKCNYNGVVCKYGELEDVDKGLYIILFKGNWTLLAY